MKNTKIKYLFILLLSCLCLPSVYADASLTDGSSSFDNGTISTTSISTSQKVYNTQEEFEKAEGAICQSATDGCNNYFLNNGKIAGGSLMLCIDFNPKWTCTNYIGEVKSYPTKEDFEKAEGAICQSATDGCNTYIVGDDGKVGIGTLMACSNVTTAWSCTNYKTEAKETKTYTTAEEFEKAEGLTCQSATDGCNTFLMTKNGKIGGGTLKACQGVTPIWSCVKKDEMVNVLSETDLETYLSIKAGKLSSESIDTINSFTQKYIDRLSKMTNSVKKTNIDALLVSIDTYVNNLIKEKNPKNLQIKLYILQLLKFNFQKEIYLLNLPVSTIRNLEYSCDSNEKISLEIDGDSLILNDNKTRRLYNLERVISADGEKFQDEINTIWLRNNEALFERNEEEFYTNCKLTSSTN